MSGIAALKPEALLLHRRLGEKLANKIKAANKSNVYDVEHQKRASVASVKSEAGQAARSKQGKAMGKAKHKNRVFQKEQRFTAFWRGQPMFCTSYLGDATDFGKIVANMDKYIELKFKGKSFRFTDVLKGANKIGNWSCKHEGLGPEQPNLDDSTKLLFNNKYPLMTELCKDAKPLKHIHPDLASHFKTFQSVLDSNSAFSAKKVLVLTDKDWENHKAQKAKDNSQPSQGA